MRVPAWWVVSLVGVGCVCQAPRGDADEVYIAGGVFTMGHDPMGLRAECIGSTEACSPPACAGATYNCNSFAPKHPTTLDPYFIDKLEVTNHQYRACVKAGFCTTPRFSGGADAKARYPDETYGEYPVFAVGWAEAQRYCQWRGRRLPTEAEWERAARGTTERDYPWGNEVPTCERLAEACAPRVPTGWYAERMRPVGTTPGDATEDGVLDLSGNASELVADVFDPLYYRISPERNPAGPPIAGNLPADTSEGRVTRGLWFDREPLNWPANQIAPAWARSDTSIAAGFRCARSLAQAGVIPKYQAIAWRRLP